MPNILSTIRLKPQTKNDGLNHKYKLKNKHIVIKSSNSTSNSNNLLIKLELEKDENKTFNHLKNDISDDECDSCSEHDHHHEHDNDELSEHTTEIIKVSTKIGICISCHTRFNYSKKNINSNNRKICNECMILGDKLCCAISGTNHKCRNRVAIGLVDYCSTHRRQYMLNKGREQNKTLCNKVRCLNFLEDFVDDKKIGEVINCLQCRETKNKIKREYYQMIITNSIHPEIRVNEEGVNLKYCGFCKSWEPEIGFITKLGKNTAHCQNCLMRSRLYDNSKREKKRKLGTGATVSQRLWPYEREHQKHPITKRWELSEPPNTFTLEANAYAISLFSMNCHYCDVPCPENNLHGIDRVDSKKIYSKDNCVPCCSMCNMMKNKTDYNLFLQRCEHIATYKNLINGTLNPSLFYYTDGYKYKKMTLYELYCFWCEEKIINRSKRIFTQSKYQNDYSMNVDETFFNEILKNNCDYCGIQSEPSKKHGGIDRVDNTRGYEKDNIVSCCSVCNIMKRHYVLNDFLEKCRLITLKFQTKPLFYSKDFKLIM